ncbi:hypothetical protein DFQ29_008135 [Apophysomyces sp. BC1021]|nr:hypothetical protein DFQ29_008135 [Apophysomyces sp. BC1021]
MLFYEAQRSGKLPENNRIPWRSDSCLMDGSDQNVDLVGGYYDAGNYLKFTLPLAHSICLLSWGAFEWWDGYVKVNQTETLRETVRWGTDWLMKAHPERDVLYVQVGDGEIDNEYWGPDTDIPTPRPSFMVNGSSPGTDVSALTAAALASAATVFRLSSDHNYADRLVSHAEELYEFAEKAQPWQVYTDAIPEARSMYETVNYTSQLVYGALWLYRATQNQDYREKASHYFDRFNLSGLDTVPMDWSDQTGATYILGAQVDKTTNKYKHAAERYLDRLIGRDSGICDYTEDGLLWCGNFSISNSLVPAQDTALLASIYSGLNSSRKDRYQAFATSQIDYLLGKNRMRTPYVVGIHMNSPQNPHHAGASGGDDLVQIATFPLQEKFVLHGAVVGGPGKDDLFFDERDDWAQTEVALDYNAPFQGLLAFQLAQGAPDPPYVSIKEPRPAFGKHRPRDDENKVDLPPWFIGLLVITCVIFLAALGHFYIYC